MSKVEYKNVTDVLERVWGVLEFEDHEKVPEVDSVGILGNTPLKIVISWGDIDAVKLLIEGGADINAVMEDGNTPLHHSILMGEFRISRILVENGAKQNIKNDEGRLPKELCWEGEWEGIFG